MELMVINQQKKIEWSPALEAVLRAVMQQAAELFELQADEVNVLLVDDVQIQELTGFIGGRIGLPMYCLLPSRRRERMNLFTTCRKRREVFWAILLSLWKLRGGRARNTGMV